MSNPTPAIDVEQRIGQYVALRDKIKLITEANDKALKPYKEALETLGNIILKHMQDTNTDSVKAGTGTAYITERQSVSLEDSDLFMKYVLANNAFDLLDRKANVTAVEEFIKKNGGLPPGTKYTKMVKIGVRRANEKED